MAVARDYRSWSFADRSFGFALAVSLLWHLFWFFSVSITVATEPVKRSVNPRILSLGPVLDDAILRTLVQSRPEVSKAFYRELSDFQAATELPIQTVERRESGDVTSLPFGEETMRSLRRLMSGDKTSPEELFRGSGFSPGAYFELEGDVEAARILSRPEPPDVNDVRATGIDFEVDSAGKVVSTEVAVSSGNETLDSRWEDHLRQWLFEPSPIVGSSDRLKGRATFRRSSVG